MGVKAQGGVEKRMRCGQEFGGEVQVGVKEELAWSSE